MDNSISIILTIHNQERIISDVFRSIHRNVSERVKEIIVIFDGCTDNSKNVVLEELLSPKYPTVTTVLCDTPDLNETRANNFGLRRSHHRYSIIIQDDCLIQEPFFDQRLFKPFIVIPKLMAVSGRDAVDTRIVDGRLDYYNCGGVDAQTSRNVFSIRDAVNRGPLMLDNEKLRELNYLDDDFAPLDSDDVDLSIRGYKQFGYLVGSFPINFSSPLSWGKTRNNPKSAYVWEQSMRKNHRLILERHYDFIVGKKHSRDVIIEWSADEN